MDTTDKDITLKYDYGVVRKSILSQWSPENYFETDNFTSDFARRQITKLWDELKIVEQTFAWNSISYLSFLITESFLRAFFLRKSGDSGFTYYPLGKMVRYAQKYLDSTDTKRQNKSPELSSTIDGFRNWRNRVVHHGIPFSDNFELRATQALVLMVRVISDIFSLPLRKFSDEFRSGDPNWWISQWRDLPPIFVITRLKRNSSDYDKLKEVISDPDLFFDHMLPFVSASRILDLSNIAKKFDIKSTKLRSAIERNFCHLIIGSGKSSIENSMRTIEALRKMGLLVYAESFAILLPLNDKLVRKALLDLDHIEITFFLREIFQEEHQMLFDAKSVTNLGEDIVDFFCKRFNIGSNELSNEKRKAIKKTIEALPHGLRNKVRNRINTVGK